MEPQLILPLCLNHARTPGVIREVHPCECCRNFEARREPSRGSRRPRRPVPRSSISRWATISSRSSMPPISTGSTGTRGDSWAGAGGLGYAYRFERGKKIFMHREIMQTPPGMVVDHKNHNPVHNRRRQPAELHAAGESAQHAGGRSQSGFAGVYPYGKRWQAQIFSGGKIVYREVFDDPVEAAKARDRKAYELFGAVAYLNFPDEIASAFR